LVNRIFIVPGNHDIDRNKIDTYRDSGVKLELINQNEITKFIKNASPIDFVRINDYKIWESKFYKNYPNKENSLFQNSFKLNIGNKLIGVACFDSSFLCKDNEDYGTLIIGNEQVVQALKFIEDCDYKIAISHHSPEFLIEIDKENFKNRISNHFDFYASGHTHKVEAAFGQSLLGNLFHSVGYYSIGKSSENIKYQRGYSYYDIENDKITGTYRVYSNQNTFVLDNYLTGNDKGQKEFILASDEKKKKDNRLNLIVENLRNRVVDKLNDKLLISSSSNQEKLTIDDIYVQPRILNEIEDFREDKKSTNYTCLDILNAEDTNFLIYGTKESGKTTLCSKLIIETINKFSEIGKIPVLIEFDKIQHNGIDRLIRSYLGVSASDIDDFLKENKVLIFIDDVVFKTNSEEHRIIITYLKRYENSNVVFLSNNKTKNTIPVEFLPYQDEYRFIVAYIQDFNSAEIKSLISKWSKNENFDFKDKMDKLLRSFGDFGLAKNPLSITLFLWIFEKQEEKPINQAVLIELFVENILEKTNIENIHLGSFDFENKKRLLSEIALKMKKDGDPYNSYRLKYSQVLVYFEEYLELKTQINPEKILNDFIKRKILIKDEETFLRFKAGFIFRYFIALQFKYNPKFLKETLIGNSYTEYVDELIFFSGIKRDSDLLLKFALGELNSSFSEMNEVLRNDSDKLNSYFNTAKGSSIVHNVNKDKTTQKIADEELNDIYDKELESIPVQDNITEVKAIPENEKVPKYVVLKFVSEVFKNSEEVKDNELRIAAYDNIIISSISFLVQYRDSLIRYLMENESLPKSFPSNINFDVIFRFLPYIHQVSLFKMIGSSKILPIIEKRIQSDKKELNISEYEKFLSVFLYCDIRGTNYSKILQDFVKGASKDYTKEISFFKILSYFHLRNNTREVDSRYVKLLAQIQQDLKRIRKKDKSSFIQGQKKLKAGKRRKM